MKDEPRLEKLIAVYGIAAVAFLAVLAVSPLKDVLKDWRHYQRAYNEMLAQQPVRIPPAPIRLQQIWDPALNRIDRCTTCHLGLKERSLAGAPQPFRTHPEVDHDVETFGCTVCHHGQGRSTEYADAHLPTQFWDEPALPRRYLEAGCGDCHREKNVRGAPVLTLGRSLIGEYSCSACHKLDGYEKAFSPPLDGIGSKVTRSWLVRWLEDPHRFRPETRMPNFLLRDEEVQLLADFLMSFQRPPDGGRTSPLPAVYLERAKEAAFIELGQVRFREARCISCHSVEGKGGHLAPDLEKIASKVTAEWLYIFIKDPRGLLPGVEMPQYGFTEQEASAITAYMMSEFVDWDAPDESVEDHKPAPDFYEQGILLFNQYNCGGCHRLNDPKITENLGPGLNDVGSRKPYQIDFGDARIPRTLHDYLHAKVKSSRVFRETLRMPQFGFSEEELQAITTALLAERSESLPAGYRVTVESPGRFTPQGEVGELFRKYACLACHKIQGVGGEIAPDLTRVGSQLRRSWMGAYFRVPYSIRPIQSERMPNLFISEREVNLLLDYFEIALVDDSLRVPGLPLGDPEAQERGRSLFWEEYGCQGCHQVGSRGGYVGPPLDRSAERLQPGWIVQWLLDPPRHKPGTLEPRSGMSPDEAKAIAAYLMTLRERG